jgi:hypothetical protein
MLVLRWTYALTLVLFTHGLAVQDVKQLAGLDHRTELLQSEHQYGVHPNAMCS